MRSFLLLKLRRINFHKMFSLVLLTITIFLLGCSTVRENISQQANPRYSEPLNDELNREIVITFPVWISENNKKNELIEAAKKLLKISVGKVRTVN